MSKFTISLTASLLLLGSTTAFAATSSDSGQAKCLYVSSYHQGYDWSDRVETGLREALQGHCEIKQFDMDTKRKRDQKDIQRAVTNALQVIKEWKPDIVITSDDNAAKHLIVPYFKDSTLPFVFSGVNWTVKEYGFPYTNVTGIVEVAPIEPMLKEAISISTGSDGVYIGANTLTEEKNYTRIAKGADRLDSTLSKTLVSSFEEWKQAVIKANSEQDYIVFGSNSGIEDWDEEVAVKFANEHSKKISVTNHRWMMGVSALGYTKIPEEHGEWAGSVAVEILAGTAPNDIPITTNRKWDLWVNQLVVDSVGASLSAKYMRKAKQLY